MELVLDDEQIQELKNSCQDDLDYVRKIRAMFGRSILDGDYDRDIESFLDNINT